MLFTSSDIKKELRDIWPTVEYTSWLMDNTFLKPPLAKVQKALEESTIPTMKFIPLFWDCDNFALEFLREYRYNRYLERERGEIPDNELFPDAVGFVFGNLFRGRPVLHAANVAVCQEGVYIIDSTPAENRLWKANKKNDNILFVFM